MVTTYPAMSVPPYAAPIAAPLGRTLAWRSPDGVSAGRIGPYVPSHCRERRVVAGETGSVWPAAPIVSGAMMDAALFGQADEASLPSINDFLESPIAADSSAWVLEQATREMTGLSAAFAVKDASRHDVRDMSQPHTAWSDTDFPELSQAPRSTAALVDEAALHEPSSMGRPSHTEYAAKALEMLALRVRAGELILPGYDPKTGDAGALVVALAALLGVRLDSSGTP